MNPSYSHLIRCVKGVVYFYVRFYEGRLMKKCVKKPCDIVVSLGCYGYYTVIQVFKDTGFAFGG